MTCVPWRGSSVAGLCRSAVDAVVMVGYGKQATCVVRRQCGHCLTVHAERFGQTRGGVSQIGAFVAAAAHRHRGEVWRIGFEQQAFGRDRRHGIGSVDFLKVSMPFIPK